MSRREPGRRLVPAYMAAARVVPGAAAYDQLTRLRRTSDWHPPGLDPAQRRVLELLAGGSLTLAEVASYLRLPIGILRTVVADLVGHGVLEARDPIPDAHAHQSGTDLLQRVLDGLIADRNS